MANCYMPLIFLFLDKGVDVIAVKDNRGKRGAEKEADKQGRTGNQGVSKRKKITVGDEGVWREEWRMIGTEIRQGGSA